MHRCHLHRCRLPHRYRHHWSRLLPRSHVRRRRHVQGATFDNVADFSTATVTGDTDFTETTFGGDTGFSEATFIGDTAFHGAKFGKKTRFRGCSFDGAAEFHSATFDTGAMFEADAVVSTDVRRWTHALTTEIHLGRR
ncbi:pentapeptide repeat-containing protein [Nocardia xishanensis]|uniref:Pentapeptide repeat-containing protein n=1 Tax=Nocardia xishanensis TaxID=238964 RepID=A0ABW7XAC0_9NOCA